MEKHCSNPNCSNIEKEKPFLRCSQCKKTYYCSKYANNILIYNYRECQSYHWKNGHKIECKKQKIIEKPLKFDCFNEQSITVPCKDISIEKIIEARPIDIWEAFTRKETIQVFYFINRVIHNQILK